MNKKNNLFLLVCHSILFFIFACTSLSAEKVAAQFNDKNIYAEKSSGRDEAVFDLGGSVDLSKGTIAFWVKPEWYGGEKSTVFLATLLDKSGTGLKVIKGTWQKSIMVEAFSNGTITGRVYQEIADWIPGFSHHVAASWSPEEMRLTIDGVSKSIVALPRPPLKQTGVSPKFQTSKFAVGGPRTVLSDPVLSDRMLSIEEIDKVRKKQRPVRLTVRIPDHPVRMVYPDERVELRIENDTLEPVKSSLTYSLENLTAETRSVEKKETLEVTIPAKSAIVAMKIPILNFGLFQLSAELKSLDGRILSQDSRPFGSGARAPSSKEVNDSPFGWTSEDGPDKYSSAVAQIGGTWIRGFNNMKSVWPKVEPEKGVFDWAFVDDQINAAKAANIHFFITLGWKVPKWASSAPDQKDPEHYAPANIDDWTNYVHRMVSRYKNVIKEWEIWPEPNGGYIVWDEKNKVPFGPYSQESARSYMNLLKETYRVIKRIDPDAKVIAPTMQGFAFSHFENLIKLGLLNYTDIVSFDIYTTPHSPEWHDAESGWSKLIRMVRDAGGKQPIWNCESGYWVTIRNTTAPMSLNDIADRFAGKDPSFRWKGDLWPSYAVDEWSVANYSIRWVLIALASGVDKPFLFSYGHKDYMFQTGDVNGSPYLHTLAFNNMTRRLVGLKFIRKVQAFDNSRYVYLFGDGKRTVAVAWTTEAADSIVLKTVDAASKVSDLFGNPVKTAVKNGKLTLPLSGMPQYVEGITADLECQKDFLSVESPAIVYDEQPIAIAANIENHGDEAMAGSVTLSLPQGWKTKDPNSQFKLNAGEKRRLNYFVDTHSASGMYTIKMIADIAGGAKIIGSKQVYKRIPALSYPERSGATTRSPLVLSNRSQVVMGLMNAGEAIADTVDDWKGPSDSSAVILTSWDVHHFYLTIDVIDKVICTKISQPWDGDCVELFIDEAATKDNVRPMVDKDCSQIFVIPEGEGKILCYKPEKIKNAKVTLRKTENGYRMEVLLPWVNFPGIKPGRGSVFGFDAIVDNADPDPSGKPVARTRIAWEGLPNNYVNSSRYGRILLTENISYRNDFESGISGWIQNRWVGGTNIGVSLDGVAFSGKQSLKITKNNSSWGGAFINVSFTNKTTYQFSCKVKLPEGAADEPALNLTVMYWLNDKVKQIAKTLTPKIIKASDGWTEVRCEFAIDAPEGTVTFDGMDSGIAFPTGTSANCSLLMDDFELRVKSP